MTQSDKKLLSAWMRRIKRVNAEISDKAKELQSLFSGEVGKHGVQKDNSTVTA